MSIGLNEFFADPRRTAVEKQAEIEGIPMGVVIPKQIFRDCGYTEDEIRDLFRMVSCDEK